MEKTIVIIDGNSLVNRAYYAMQRPMITKSGLYTQGVYGFINMLSKIKKNELDGILAWAVRGCLLWQQEGLAMPDTANIATKQYRDEMDSFAQFFEECCERKENARTSNKLLRAKYDEWCKDNGIEYEK